MYQGECERCGVCCTRLVRQRNGVEVRYTCANLVKADGKTQCSKYLTRKSGMPILMIAEHEPLFAYTSRCLVEYPRPVDAIPPECSYQWVSIEKQPDWNPHYAAKF